MHSKSTTTFYSLKVVSTIKNRISNAQQIYHSEIKCRPFYFIYRLYPILEKKNTSKTQKVHHLSSSCTNNTALFRSKKKKYKK